MKGFELTLDLGVGVEEAFHQFVDSVAFEERFHALVHHTDVAVGNWDHTNSRTIEFRRSVSTNEALAPITGGRQVVDLREEQQFAYLQADKIQVTSTVRVADAPDDAASSLYVHTEFLFVSQKTAKKASREGASSRILVKFRTSYGGALHHSVESYVQNAAYKVLCAWKCLVLDVAPHTEPMGAPETTKERKEEEKAVSALCPTTRRNMFEVTQHGALERSPSSPTAAVTRLSALEAGAKGGVARLKAAGKRPVDSEDEDDFYDTEDTIAMSDFDSLSRSAKEESLLSLVIGLQQETSQLREMLLATQSRIMVLELAVEDQHAGGTAGGSKKQQQAAQDAAGSFRLYYKQMADLYAEMNDMEEQRAATWQQHLRELESLRGGSVTSDRLVPAASGKHSKAKTAPAAIMEMHGREKSALALHGVHKRQGDSSLAYGLKWAAIGAAAVAGGTVAALLLRAVVDRARSD